MVNRIRVCSDNSVAISWLNNRKKTTGSSQAEVDKIKDYVAYSRRLQPGLKVHCIWVPGHEQMVGNEAADSLAKAATARSDEGDNFGASHANMRRWVKEKQHRKFLDHLLSHPDVTKPPERLESELPKPQLPFIPHAPQPTLATLLAAWTGHGDFPVYHMSRKHTEYETACERCGEVFWRTHACSAVCRQGSCGQQPSFKSCSRRARAARPWPTS